MRGVYHKNIFCQIFLILKKGSTSRLFSDYRISPIIGRGIREEV